jgi:hypothetical protein
MSSTLHGSLDEGLRGQIFLVKNGDAITGAAFDRNWRHIPASTKFICEGGNSMIVTHFSSCSAFPSLQHPLNAAAWAIVLWLVFLRFSRFKEEGTHVVFDHVLHRNPNATHVHQRTG